MNKLEEVIKEYVESGIKINNDQIIHMSNLGWSVDLNRSGFSQNCTTGQVTFMPTFIMNINKDLEVYIRQNGLDGIIKWSLVARQLYDFKELDIELPDETTEYLKDGEFFIYDDTNEVYLSNESNLEEVMSLVDMIRKTK